MTPKQAAQVARGSIHAISVKALILVPRNSLPRSSFVFFVLGKRLRVFALFRTVRMVIYVIQIKPMVGG